MDVFSSEFMYPISTNQINKSSLNGIASERAIPNEKPCTYFICFGFGLFILCLDVCVCVLVILFHYSEEFSTMCSRTWISVQLIPLYRKFHLKMCFRQINIHVYQNHTTTDTAFSISTIHSIFFFSHLFSFRRQTFSILFICTFLILHLVCLVSCAKDKEHDLCL